MQRITLQAVTRQVPVSSAPGGEATSGYSAATLRPAQHVSEEPRVQPLSDARVIRAQPEVVSYSPAQQMAQPCWPPMQPQVRYEVRQPDVRQVDLRQSDMPQQRLSLQAVPAVQPLRPGVPQSYFTDGQPLDYEAPSFFEQPFSQTGPYLPDEGYYAGEVDEAQLYHAQLMQQQMDGLEEAPMDEHDQTREPQSNQFMSLLESLEARVDLMAQMQHTRAAIQKRAGAIEEMKVRQHGGAIQALEDVGGQRFNHIAETRAVVPSREVQAYQTEVVVPYERDQQALALSREATSHLARENAELWSQMRDQKHLISRLTDEVEGMREQMTALTPMADSSSAATFGIGPPTAAYPDGEILGGRGQGYYPDSMNQADLARYLDQSPAQAGPLERLMAAEGTGGLGTAVDVTRSDMQSQLRNMQSTGGAVNAQAEKRRLSLELEAERQQQDLSAQQWMEERNRLYAEIGQARAASAVAEQRASLLDATAPVTPIEQTISRFPREPFVVGPFSHQTCGVNLSLSEDGYTATRTRGCRQSVAIGSSPLDRQANGWFFEVTVGETVTGWVGGLGVGVTRSPPESLRRVPDKAWRLPGTYIVGYWGCVFLDGQERRTRWRSDTLQAGARIGLLVTTGGDLIVFVDDVPVVFAAGALRESSRLQPVNDLNAGADALVTNDRGIEPLYPVVDVFAATRVVTLSARAFSPQPPYKVEPKTLSPPGSPQSVAMRSVRSLDNTQASLE